MNEKDISNTEQENPVVPITRFRRSRKNKERRYSAFIIARCNKLTNEILSREKQKVKQLD